MTKYRKSLGGSSIYNIRSSSEPRRRSSFDPHDDPPPPQKDRRALLEEWRRKKKLSSSVSSHSSEDNKSSVFRQETPPLSARPISTRKYDSPEPSTALQRFRLKRQQQLQEQQQSQPLENKENGGPSLSKLPPHPPSVESEKIVAREFRGSKILSLTPRISLSSGKRRRSYSAGARRIRNEEVSDSVAKEIVEPPYHAEPSPLPRSSNFPSTIETAGLQSRVSEMQQRITKLEQEKLDLTKSKAPLEARIRQKEDAWIKEESRLLEDIEKLNVAAKEIDSKYRELEMQMSSVQEERNKYKYEALKAASSLRAGDKDETDMKIQNESEIIEMMNKVRDAEDEIKTLRLEKVSLETDLDETGRQLFSLHQNYEELRDEFEELEANKSKTSDAEIQLQVLTTEHIATAAQLNAVCSDLAATKSSAQAALEEKEKEWKKEAHGLKFEITVLKTRGVVYQGEKVEVQSYDVEDEAVLRARIEERDARIAELETQLTKGERLRRKMHNRIQELRGNIRVYVRTRPFLPADTRDRNACTTSAIDVLPDGESLFIKDQKSNDIKFNFDKVFPPSAGQDVVFEEVSDFVQSALDGYHVCLFSYGQTGSGKTHTMQGSGIGAMRGIIPRSVAKILSQAQALQNQKWTFRITASFMEIYNEELKDLLIHKKDKILTRNETRSRTKLNIKRGTDGKHYVDGITKINIDTKNIQNGLSQLSELMSNAARCRSVAATNMNAHSSRSHSIFMLHLNGQNVDTGAIVQGALNLCDLAGSERLDRSGASSDQRRLKETQAINKSLSCLGDVFNALGSGSKHVPYRNSKLTYLLQDCLSGDGKALMFVNLSPTIPSCNESLCSLRFAQRVNQVELGRATKHIQYKKARR